ncbi:TRAP transporter small permease [Salinisphaera hydrothermalis]|uniref:TRAP transporter small permease n=1 Tax=Salinisphaera hydrothermalis TaxID=563188 RepID=UPI000A01C5A8|nr:TRAP transporter small permease [Salinisphaera hydrothermalis]
MSVRPVADARAEPADSGRGSAGLDRQGSSNSAEASTGHTVPAGLAVARRVLDGIAWLCMLAAGLGLVFIVASFGWLVYGRYILNNTPTWIEQLSLLLIIYIVCLGTAVGVHRHTHLSIDFVRDGLPRWPRRILHVLADLMVVAFGVIMLWQGWVLTLTNADHQLPMLGVTASWRAAPLVLCGALIVVFTVFDFIERLFTNPGELH